MTGFLEYTFFESWEQFLVIGCIIFISQIIYATIGFGSGMFAISLLALFYGKLNIFVPFFVLLCAPTELYITWKDRKLIDLKHHWKFILAICPFLFLGSFLLSYAQNSFVLILLGILIIFLATYHLLWEEKLHFNLSSKFWIPFFGSISGILGGLFGMAGPPLIFFFKNQRMEKKNFRVALLSIFALMTLMRITFYLQLNFFTREMILSSIFILIFALTGMGIGYKLHDVISEKLFKQITSVALFISGLLIVVKNIMKIF